MKTFKTSDINLIASLNYHGYLSCGLERTESGRVEAHYELSSEAMNIVTKFETRSLRVEPQTFSEMRKNFIRKIEGFGS